MPDEKKLALKEAKAEDLKQSCDAAARKQEAGLQVARRVRE